MRVVTAARRSSVRDGRLVCSEPKGSCRETEWVSFDFNKDRHNRYVLELQLSTMINEGKIKWSISVQSIRMLSIDQGSTKHRPFR